MKIAANIRVIVNMDKNIPASGGELPAVLMSFVKPDEGSAAADAIKLSAEAPPPAAEAED